RRLALRRFALRRFVRRRRLLRIFRELEPARRRLLAHRVADGAVKGVLVVLGLLLHLFGHVGVALRAGFLDLLRDVGTTAARLVDALELLLGRHLPHLLRELLLLHVFDLHAPRLHGVDEVVAVHVGRPALGHRASGAGGAVGPGGVGVLRLLVLARGGAGDPEPEIGVVDRGRERGELGVEGGRDRDGAVLLVDRGELPVGALRDFPPGRREAVGGIAAVDRVDQDAVLDQVLADVPEVELAVLLRRLVAGDDDQLERILLLRPGESRRRVEDARDELRAAVGLEREELRRDGVEVLGEGRVDGDPAALGVVAVVAVREQRDAQPRRRRRERQVVHDRPDLLARRVDQPVHAAARVEADGEVDGSPRRRRAGGPLHGLGVAVARGRG